MHQNCVIEDADDHAPLSSTSKPGVFTWVCEGQSNPPRIFGAVHCALSLCTHSLEIQQDNSYAYQTLQGLTFVELPKSILDKCVLELGLLAPFDGSFKNPLPPERDVIAIRVQETPTFPICTYVAPPANIVEYDSECTSVAGRSHGSIVSSKHGLVSVRPGALPYTGFATFMLDVGEPDDSGTLLHFKCDDSDNRAFAPGAVFRGLSPANSLHSTRRGIAAILPPADQFTMLGVCDVLACYPNASISCRVGTKDGDFDCTVESEVTLGGTKAVKLVSPQGGCKYGVFVHTEKPIKYTGEKEWAMMNGSMLLPDPSIDRSFSKV
jgi:hypothetical protein